MFQVKLDGFNLNFFTRLTKLTTNLFELNNTIRCDIKCFVRVLYRFMRMSTCVIKCINIYSLICFILLVIRQLKIVLRITVIC